MIPIVEVPRSKCGFYRAARSCSASGRDIEGSASDWLAVRRESKRERIEIGEIETHTSLLIPHRVPLCTRSLDEVTRRRQDSHRIGDRLPPD